MELGVVALVVAALIVITRMFRWATGGEADEELARLKSEYVPKTSSRPRDQTVWEQMAALSPARAGLPGLDAEDEMCLEVALEPLEDTFELQMRVGESELLLGEVEWDEEPEEGAVLSGEGWLEVEYLDALLEMLGHMAAWLGVEPPELEQEGTTSSLVCGLDYLGHGRDARSRHWHVLGIRPLYGTSPAMLLRVDPDAGRAMFVREDDEDVRWQWLFWLGDLKERDPLRDPTLATRTPLVSELEPLAGSHDAMDGFHFLDAETLIAFDPGEEGPCRALRWSSWGEEPVEVAAIEGAYCGSAVRDEVAAVVLEGDDEAILAHVELRSGEVRELGRWEDAEPDAEVFWAPRGGSVAIALWSEEAEEARVVVMDVHGGERASVVAGEVALSLLGWDEDGLWWQTEDADVRRWRPSGWDEPEDAEHSPVMNETYEVVVERKGLAVRRRLGGEVVSRRPCWTWADAVLQRSGELAEVEWLTERALLIPLSSPVLFDVVEGRGWVVVDTEEEHDHVYYVDLVSKLGVVCSSFKGDMQYVGRMTWPIEEGLW